MQPCILYVVSWISAHGHLEEREWALTLRTVCAYNIYLMPSLHTESTDSMIHGVIKLGGGCLLRTLWYLYPNSVEQKRAMQKYEGVWEGYRSQYESIGRAQELRKAREELQMSSDHCELWKHRSPWQQICTCTSVYISGQRLTIQKQAHVCMVGVV